MIKYFTNNISVIALLSVLAAVSTVIMGGIVRVTGSGLGCPDWPLCYGQIIPPFDMAAWIEYLHRLSATLSGVLTMTTLLISVNKFGFNHLITRIMIIATILLFIQALLGAYTVLTELSPYIATIHTAVGITYVAILTTIFALTSTFHFPELNYSEQTVKEFKNSNLILSIQTFVLLISGTIVARTVGAPLACTSFPLCGVSITEMIDIHWIHMLHRVLGLLVILYLSHTIIRGLRLKMPLMNNMLYFISVLLIIQVIFGLGNVVLKLPTEIRAMHVATGILFFTSSTLLTARLWKTSILKE